LERAEQFQPDVILLNASLPRLSGLDACKRLKEEPETRHAIVMVVISETDNVDVVNQAVTFGADDVLSKPVTKIELVKRMELLLELKRVKDERERLKDRLD